MNLYNFDFHFVNKLKFNYSLNIIISNKYYSIFK